MDKTCPGGWKKDTEEKTWQTATREALEECGLVVNDPVQVGEVITNRAINIKNESDPYPTTFFAMKVEWDDLAVGENIVLRKGEKTNPDIDKLSTLEFLDVYKAMVLSKDCLAVTAFAKTLAAFKNGVIK